MMLEDDRRPGSSSAITGAPATLARILAIQLPDVISIGISSQTKATDRLEPKARGPMLALTLLIAGVKLPRQADDGPRGQVTAVAPRDA